MDLTRSHYDAGEGKLYTFDAATRDIKESKVRYANPSPYQIDAGLNARVGGLMPDIAFQDKFRFAFFEAFDEVQKNGSPFQFDRNRLANFTGQGFIDGDLTFFLERQDKPGDANFKCEFRATMAVNQFDGGVKSLIAYIKKELQTIEAKQG
jgi:hypothetical protein